ncbi:MAG: hypothetical protein E6J90_14625 [Deltaproteobacteria bacterium]|nr:MAG: hypothetical protein E6J91_47225 [Deltaproteobacteria bacterium]TMQ21189.1 MAG: hypothetical protein E6J90_14625 [Deltaproteobacteria bacterium]
MSSGKVAQCSDGKPSVMVHCTPSSAGGSVYTASPPTWNGRRCARSPLPRNARTEALCVSLAISAASGAAFAVSSGPR